MNSMGNLSFYDMTLRWMFLSLFACIFLPLPAFAGTLSVVSNVISSSAPSATTTTHTLTFTTGTIVPAGGSIILAFQPTAGIPFIIPAALDFTDVDFAISVGAGPFVDRTLAAAPSVTDDGVAVVSGSSGSIVITLASGAAAIPVGATVRIEIGSNATFGVTGDQFIESPASQNSYHIRIYTRDLLNGTIDGGSTMIALVAPVTVTGASGIIVPPVRSNGLPSGLLPGSTASVMLSLNTDIPGTCKYATSSGVAFYSMSSSTIFTKANAELLHYQSFAVATNTVYSINVRCYNANFIFNTDDYLITFEIGVVPNASSTPPPPPAPPPPPPAPSGPSGGGGGGGGLFMGTGEVTLEGLAFPGGTLIVTQDGVVVKEVAVASLGNFSENIKQLQRGTYNWGVSVRDASGRKSSIYSSTIYLLGKTNNIIAPIYLSPTISAVSKTVPVGDDVVLSGFAIPLRPVQVLMNKQGDVLNAKIVSATTTANGNGSWALKLSTKNLSKGTYEVKAVSLVNDKDRSLLSTTLYIGLGEDPNPNFENRSDLNRDGKVNLVDFSILLFNWKGSDAIADINQDGTVSLTDFSIMLANWTG